MNPPRPGPDATPLPDRPGPDEPRGGSSTAPGRSSAFDAEVVSAVVRHVNDDHADSCRAICGDRLGGDVFSAELVGYDASGAEFRATTADGTHELVVPWLGQVRHRADVRREFVALTQRVRPAGDRHSSGP